MLCTAYVAIELNILVLLLASQPTSQIYSTIKHIYRYSAGMYGVKSASPIVLAPQACALALGSIIDTVVPRVGAKEGENEWVVAPVMIATLSCDHRVVDGAVGAQWLAALKTFIENPTSMLL